MKGLSNIQMVFVSQELGLCEITPEFCEKSGKVDDGPNDDGHLETHGSKEEYYNKLRERISALKARKDEYEKDIKWLKDRLDECEEEKTKTSKTTLTTTPEPTTTTTPKPTTTTTPEPKQKKYIIRTDKVI